MKTPTLAALALSCSTLAACGDVVPRDGVWFHDPGEILENNCPFEQFGAETPRDPYGEFTITNTGEGSFRIDIDGQDPFDCSLDAGDFTCPSRLAFEETYADVGVTVRGNVSVSGTFTSDSEAEGEQMFAATCEGSLCPQEACDYRIAFTATAR